MAEKRDGKSSILVIKRLATVDDYEGVNSLYEPIGDYLARNYHFYLTYRTNYCMVATVDGEVVSFGFVSMIDGGKTMMVRGGRTRSHLRKLGLVSQLLALTTDRWSGRYPNYERQRYVVSTDIVHGVSRKPLPFRIVGRRIKLEYVFTNSTVTSTLTPNLIETGSVTTEGALILLTAWQQVRSLLMNPSTAGRCFLPPDGTVLISRIPYQCGVWENLDVIRDNEKPTVFSDADAEGKATSSSFATVYEQTDGGATLRLDVDVFSLGDPRVATHHLLLQLKHYLDGVARPGRERTYLTLTFDEALHGAGGRERIHDLCRHKLRMDITETRKTCPDMSNYFIVVGEESRENLLQAKL